MKIKKGDVINELSLPAIDGSVFDLQFVQGQKLMISFYRYSSCPFCHLRINETINNFFMIGFILTLKNVLLHRALYQNNPVYQSFQSFFQLSHFLSYTIDATSTYIY